MQTTNDKRQIPNESSTRDSDRRSLGFGGWDFFGIWDLGFGIFRRLSPAMLFLLASCSGGSQYHYTLSPLPPDEPLPDSFREPAVYKVEDGGKICRVHIRRRIPYVVVLDPSVEPGVGPKQRWAFPEEQERVLARMKADVQSRTLDQKLERDHALREEELAARKEITPELVTRMERAVEDVAAEKRDRERELRANELSGYQDPDDAQIRRRLSELTRQEAVYRLRLALLLLRAREQGKPLPPGHAS